jgi:chromosomal replication initiator protein
LDAFRRRFRSCNALLLDDVQFLAGREKTQQEFQHTFDVLLRDGRQMVLTANAVPAQISRMHAALTARLSSGLNARLHGPDLPARIQLVREKAAAKGLRPTEDVVELLAIRPTGDVRELEGIVCKLAALSAAEGLPASTDLARRALRELGCLRLGPPTLEEVLDAAAKTFGVAADAIRSSRRGARLVAIRYATMYLARRYTDCGTAEIGRFFGGRNHTAVCLAVKKTEATIERDAELRVALENLGRLFSAQK